MWSALNKCAALCVTIITKEKVMNLRGSKRTWKKIVGQKVKARVGDDKCTNVGNSQEKNSAKKVEFEWSLPHREQCFMKS